MTRMGRIKELVLRPIRVIGVIRGYTCPEFLADQLPEQHVEIAFGIGCGRFESAIRLQKQGETGGELFPLEFPARGGKIGGLPDRNESGRRNVVCATFPDERLSDEKLAPDTYDSRQD